jgi:hypothetical protein
MRECARDMFTALLKDDSFTWDEMADVLIKNVSKFNIGELIAYLQEKNGKRKK